MSHSSKCANATKMPASQCQCSCNGALHPKGVSRTTASSSSSNSSVSKEDVKDSAKAVGKTLVISGVVATNPQLAPVYKLYTAGKAGKTIHDEWQGSKESEKFSNTVKETTKQGIAFQTRDMTDDEAGEIAQDLRNTVDDAGGLDYLSDTTNGEVDSEVFGKMLEGSTKGALKSGSVEVSKMALEVTV